MLSDDMAENASTERKLQETMDRVSQACDHYYLKLSTQKTVVVYQPAPGKPYSKPTVTVNGQRLQIVDKFIYLGCTCLESAHV